MTYHVALTEQADSDLRGIYEYIAFSLLEPENAAGQIDRLEENILKLTDMPMLRLSAIEIPYRQECKIEEKIKKEDNPILFATYLIYAKYDSIYFEKILNEIEKL